MDYLSIDGVIYYIDINEISNLLSPDVSYDEQIIEDSENKVVYGEKGEVIENVVLLKKRNKPKEIDGARFELLKHLLDIVLAYYEIEDSDMGITFDKYPPSFKIAFNTLLDYKIIKTK